MQICFCLPTLPTRHHAVPVPQHKATASSLGHSEQEECAGRRALAWPAGPPAICGFGICSEQWSRRHKREGDEPGRGLGGSGWGLQGLPRWQQSGNLLRHQCTPGPWRASRTGHAQSSPPLLLAQCPELSNTCWDSFRLETSVPSSVAASLSRPREEQACILSSYWDPHTCMWFICTVFISPHNRHRVDSMTPVYRCGAQASEK